MSLTLHLDVVDWREHLTTMRDRVEGLVPVAKGNGYGYGLPRLAAEASLLGVDTVAVGISAEVAQVAPGFAGDIVVLTPWSRFDPVAEQLLADKRVITTVASIDDLAEIRRRQPGARVIVEVLTSMKRHGLAAGDLGRVPAAAEGLRFEGWTIHLPMVGDTVAEARRLAEQSTAVVAAPVWFSHLPLDAYDRLRAELPAGARLRIGTKLWLGAPQTRRVTARVLDMHPVKRGERVGYWQRRAKADGWVVVVSGGTANGVALTAPTSASTMRARLVTVATGAMDATGMALSPYTIAGKKRMFVEPPHMQSSLVFLPGAGAVAVGDEVPVEVRLTTASADRVVEH